MKEENQDIEEQEHKPKKPKKPKKGKNSNSSAKPLTAEELAELKKTESELGISKPKFICVVHKGPIDGEIYLCPHCHTFYCEKCAKALKLQEERCWACGNQITISITKLENLSTDFDDMISILESDMTKEISEKSHKQREELKRKIIKAEKSLTKGEFKDAVKKYENAIILAVETGEAEVASALTAKTTQIKKLVPEKLEKAKEEKHIEKFEKKMLKVTQNLTKMIVTHDKKTEESLETKVIKASIDLAKKAKNNHD